MVCENYREVDHFSAIHTCPAMEPLALSRALFSISYLIVISSGWFLNFFPLALAAQKTVSWQNFPSAQLNPWWPLSCFRKSH